MKVFQLIEKLQKLDPNATTGIAAKSTWFARMPMQMVIIMLF
jgi:hypothetical protein